MFQHSAINEENKGVRKKYKVLEYRMNNQQKGGDQNICIDDSKI